jgi:hypothetical protein
VREHFANNWNPVFYLMAGSYVLAAVLWMWIDPVTPVQKPDVEAA